ncbi:MAG: sulfite exporter TauE/SafE family protein, partial [Clostridia bacterium]|nr:sulfite exporter TauE/SafE family protein [Clostridia bacterium]
MEQILIFIICIGGAVVQGMSGFGYALTVMLFLPLVIPLELASLVVSMQNIIASGYSMYKYREHIEYKTAAVPVMASVALTPIGVYILLFSNQAVLKEILGYTIVVLSVITYINNKKTIEVKTTLKNGIAAGSVSGILGGMFGTGGPPLVIYYL